MRFLCPLGARQIPENIFGPTDLAPKFFAHLTLPIWSGPSRESFRPAVTGETSTWKDAFERLSVDRRFRVLLVAFEAAARAAEKNIGSTELPSGLALAMDPAVHFLKDYEVYARKARRYQMRQRAKRVWTEDDLTRVLAWKAVCEVQDHLRKIRAAIVKPLRTSRASLASDETHQSWIKIVVSHLAAQESKAAHDATVFVRYLWSNGNALTETPKRGISFKAKSIARELSRIENEPWDENRVQRARSFVTREMSRFKGSSIAEIVKTIQQATMSGSTS
jgi:hypothetical protein